SAARGWPVRRPLVPGLRRPRAHFHRLIALGFPEFPRYVRDLGRALATAILHDYPTAAAFQGVSLRRLTGHRYDGRHRLGDDLAQALLDAAARSVGRHHSEAYRIQVRYICEDLDRLRHRLRDLEHDIQRLLADHEVGTLLTTIAGIGPHTAARLWPPSTTSRASAAAPPSPATRASSPPSGSPANAPRPAPA